MKKVYIGLALIWAISTRPAMSQVGKICNWDNDRKAAVVLTFDDWTPGQFPTATGELKSRNMIATFFVIANNASASNTGRTYPWADVQIEINNGNEIGNHTFSHPYLSQLNTWATPPPSDVSTYATLTAQITKEVGGAKNMIQQNITNQAILTFAYPFGDYNAQVLDSVLANGHICARGVTPPTNFTYSFASSQSDYYNLNTFSMGTGVPGGAPTTAQFFGQLQNVINGGGLVTFLYHSLDSPTLPDTWYSPVEVPDFEKQMDTLVSVRNQLWITTLMQAIKYHKEKNCAALTQIQAPSNTQWVLNLTDTLSNNVVYNQPLTLKLKTKGIIYSSIQQNGVPLKIDSIYNDTIMFRAVPDAGYITLYVDQNANSKNIGVKDSTFNNGANNIPVYIITWTDNNGKPRTAWMTKPYATDNYPGICVRFTYYDASNNLITINSTTPSNPLLEDRGFGTTVHHIANGSYLTQGTNITLTLRNQGAHYAIFDLTQTVDGGALESVTYSFFDGLDYFQWQETVKCGTTGTDYLDSRGPYCTMDWDGNGAFDVIDGQEYGAQKYFSEPTYVANNGAYTFGGTCDIPYMLEWKGTHEVGYVQTQTFTQQLAGVPDWNVNLPASGTVDTLNKYAWALDFQMNIYDMLQKITWGMPYGYMEGQPNNGLTHIGTKSGYGQYSLSIMFDAMSSGGVKRIMNENRIIQNGNVTLTAVLGTVVTTGPVGTANPNTQTLSPAGYDQNYRAWWLQVNPSDQVQITMNVATGSLVNPNFRIAGISQLPTVVSFNGTLLVANTDYYASYDATNKQAWVTLLKTVTGSNSLLIQGSNTGVVINSATVTPTSVSNHAATNVNFTVAATVGGTIQSVTIDLSSIGGSATTAFTKGTTNYGLAYSIPVGTPTGAYSFPIKVTDNIGNAQTGAIPFTITSGIVISSATVTPPFVSNTVASSMTFAVSATDDGSVAGVALNLSSIGGDTSVSMTNIGGSDYTLNYTAPKGIAEGSQTIVATVTDDQGNKLSRNIILTVAGPVSRKAIYTDTATMITGVWPQTTSLVEQVTTTAEEGVKDYLFTFNSAADSYFAGFGLNISNWSVPGKNDFTGYDSLQIAYNGPVSTNATGIQVQFTDGTPNISECATCTNLSGGPTLPAVSTYTVVKIPMSAFNAGHTIDMTKVAELDISITGFGAAATSGTLRVDNIQLIKKLGSTVTAIAPSEMTNSSNTLSVYPNPNNGSFTLQSTVEGTYSIVNDQGQTVKQVTLNGANNNTAIVENLNTGMYVIVGSTNTGKSNPKIIVTK